MDENTTESIAYDFYAQFTHLEPFTYDTFLKLVFGIRVCVIGPISLVGIVSNTINVIVFYRQGLSESSSTVTLTALAVSDFWCCLLNLAGGIFSGIGFFIDMLKTYRIVENRIDVYAITRPQDMFAQITCYVTLYATFERVIGVTFPFKVKQMFNAKRTLIIMVLVYFVTFITFIPTMFKSVPGFVEAGGVSYFTYVRSTIPDSLLKTAEAINTTFLKTASIVLVFTCNMIILWKVKLSQKFRNTSANVQSEKEGGEQGQGKVDKKEMRLLRMITVISTLFVVCYLPHIPYVVVFEYIYVVFETTHMFTIYMAYFGVTLLTALNASVNFIIYYRMSTRYREEFNILFGRQEK